MAVVHSTRRDLLGFMFEDLVPVALRANLVGAVLKENCGRGFAGEGVIVEPVSLCFGGVVNRDENTNVRFHSNETDERNQQR